jgi:hypothetical protein
MTVNNDYAMTNGVNMLGGAFWDIDVEGPLGGPPLSFTKYVITAPNTLNPRYGEFNYFGVFYFEIFFVN